MSIQKGLSEVLVEPTAHDFDAGQESTTHTRPASNPAGAKERPTSADFYDFARSILEARRIRDQLVDREFFGEPAWDMLLVLYCAEQDGETIGSTILSERARVPLTTGLRYLRNLVGTGMAERGQSDADRRIQVVRLTRQAKENLEAYFRMVLSGSNGTFSVPRSKQPC